ncbi:MAG: hypothetical protein ACRCVT_13980, partial [Leadbetterella sp.]
MSQDLCTDPAYDRSNFNLSATEICVTTNLNVTDQSGGFGTRYVFDYKGESLVEARANSLGVSTYKYATTSKRETREFTILQITTVGNKVATSCKKVLVRQTNEPVFSYTYCSIAPPNNANVKIEITIPKHPFNTYDNYVLSSLPSTVANTSFSSSDLPKSFTFTTNLSNTLSSIQLITLSGNFISKPQVCTVTNFGNLIYSISNSLPTGYLPSNGVANVDRIELTSTDKLNLSFTGDYTEKVANQYTLYGYKNGNSANPTKPIVISSFKPGKVDILLPTSNEIYCFYAERTNHCGFSERSPELCTIPLLKLTAPPGATSIRLDYLQYPVNRMFGLTASGPQNQFNHILT